MAGQIERCFVRIAEGQVHLRSSAGSASPDAASKSLPLWMVHASPASSISLVGLMTELAKTRRVIAPDTLGNGDSAAPAVPSPDIGYYAAASLRVMDALGIERADLYGSHTGAHIVLEMALAQPQRFGRVVLDGIPVFSASEKADLLAHYAPAIKPDSFGTQFHWAWHFVRDQGWFFPYYRRDAAHLCGIDAPSSEVLHTTTLEVLKSIRTYHLAYRAAFSHADRERLPLLRLPALIMADSRDPLRSGVALAASLLPGSQHCIVSGVKDDAGRSEKGARIAGFLDAR